MDKDGVTRVEAKGLEAGDEVGLGDCGFGHRGCVVIVRGLLAGLRQFVRRRTCR